MQVNMKRRDFMRKAGAAGTIGTVGLAGCIGGGSNAPPPRKSNVVEAVKVSDDSLTVNLEDDTWIESRAELDGSGDTGTGDSTQSSLATGALASLSPIGVASAKGKGGGGGRGAAGRAAGGYSKAPKTGKGRAKYHGGAYVGTWRDDHDDEIEKYPAIVSLIGFAFLGTAEQFEEDKPGPGPVPWDQTVEPNTGGESDSTTEETDSGNETATETETETETGTETESSDDTATAKQIADRHEFPIDSPGWYRIGTKLETPNGKHTFGWENIDFKVEEADDGSYEVTKQWKVSPRL